MKWLIFILCTMLLLIGCSPQVKVIRYNSEVYAATTKVEVLRTKPPDKLYDELGELEVKNNSDNAVERLVEKAKEIGADAIILMGERDKGAVSIPIGGLYYSKTIVLIWAVAIKYR